MLHFHTPRKAGGEGRGSIEVELWTNYSAFIPIVH